MRAYAMILLKWIAGGLICATLFSAWVTFLRITAGTAPFAANDTTYSATVASYYAGGFLGGFLAGLFHPLRRWVFGYAILGMLAVFPVYMGIGLANVSRTTLFSDENLFFSIFASVTVGGIAGILTWMKDHPQGPAWLDALRHPTVRIVIGIWVVALALAVTGYFGVSRWTSHASFTIELLAAVVFFIGPLGLAALVTAARYSRGKDLDLY